MNMQFKRIIAGVLCASMLPFGAFALSPDDVTDAYPITGDIYDIIDTDEATGAPNFESGLLLASKDGKFGYLDNDGMVAIDFVYSDALPFNDGVAPVYQDGLWGFIDMQGNRVLDGMYFSLTVTPTGEYLVMDGNGTGVVSRDGKVVVAPSSSYLEMVPPYYIVEGEESDDFYFDGNLIYSFDRDAAAKSSGIESVTAYSDGYVVTFKNGTYGLEDFEGNTIFAPTSFGEIVPLGENGELFNENGIAMYRTEEVGRSALYGFITGEGNHVGRRYTYISEFSEGLAYATNSALEAVIVGDDGELVEDLDKVYGTMYAFSNGMAVLYSEDFSEATLVSAEGDVGDMRYTTVGDFNGKVSVATTGSVSMMYEGPVMSHASGLLDADGRFVTADGMPDIDPVFYGEYFIVKKDNMYGIINSEGKNTVEIMYDDIVHISEYLPEGAKTDTPVFIARLENSFGVIGAEGEIHVPVEFDSITAHAASEGVYTITVPYATYYLDGEDFTLITKVPYEAGGISNGTFVTAEGRGVILMSISGERADPSVSYIEKDSDFSFLPYEDLESVSGGIRGIAVEAIESFPEDMKGNGDYLEALYDFLEEAMAKDAELLYTASSYRTDSLEEDLVVIQEEFEANDIPMNRELKQILRVEMPHRQEAEFSLETLSELGVATHLELKTDMGSIMLDMATAKANPSAVITLTATEDGMSVTTSDDISYIIMFDGTDTDKDDAIFRDQNPIGGNMNMASGYISAPTSGSADYMVSANGIAFADLAGTQSEMRDAIDMLSSKGIINGKTSTTFDPYAPISRAEIAALMLRVAGLDSVAAQGSFSDVTEANWYYEVAGSVKTLGLIEGYEDGTFRGDGTITRSEIYVILARYLTELEGYMAAEGLYYDFADDNSIPAWAEDGINLSARENLIPERTDYMLDPSGLMTRGEAAMVIARLFEKLN